LTPNLHAPKCTRVSPTLPLTGCGFQSTRLSRSCYGTLVLPTFDNFRVARDSSIAESLYGHFATSFLIVFVLRIVNGTQSTFASGTVEKSDMPGFLRRHQ